MSYNSEQCGHKRQAQQPRPPIYKSQIESSDVLEFFGSPIYGEPAQCLDYQEPSRQMAPSMDDDGSLCK